MSGEDAVVTGNPVSSARFRASNALLYSFMDAILIT